ncbi:tenascin-R [Procambarus clarkii]|uniref:tenascin-R n=1 Tax=Procambarus clarkii TaxID=6728 RepID=UPI0037423122
MSARKWLSVMLLVVGPLTLTTAQLQPQDDEYEVSLDLSLSAGTEDISARWNEVPEASSYSITWTPEDNGGTATVNGSSNTQYSIKGLKACTDYTVTVQAINETDAGDSENANATTKAKDSLAVKNLTVVNDKNDMTVLLASWTQPSKPGNCDVYYKISWNDSINAMTDEVPEISNYTIVGLTPCTRYVVGVTTRTSENYAVWQYQNATTGSLDLGLRADMDEISVSWSALSDATTYNINWSPEDNGGAGSAGSGETSYNISSLEKCTWYTVTVQAMDDANQVLCSNNDSIRTDKDLLQLSLSAGTEDISARWNEVPEASSYSITWTPEDNGGTATVDGSSNSQYSIKGLKACTDYSVTVQAINETGDVGCSETSSRITKAKDSLAVKNLTVVNDESNMTVLLASWIQPAKPGNCDVYYKISWSDGDNTKDDELTDISNYTIVGLTPCTRYVVGVTTRTSENYAVWQYQNASTGETELLDLSLSAETENITAHWNEMPDASSYTITWTQVDNNETTTVDVVNSTIYTIEGLMPCTEYRVTVQAMNDTGNDGCWDTVKKHTKTNAPESFRAESIKTKKVTLSWSDANTECQALGYQLSYGTTVVNVSATTHQYTVTGLKAKKSYSFSLKTVTNSGESENVSLTISTKVDGVAIGVGVSVGVLVVVAAVLGYIYRDKLRCSRETKKDVIM